VYSGTPQQAKFIRNCMKLHEVFEKAKGQPNRPSFSEYGGDEEDETGLEVANDVNGEEEQKQERKSLASAPMTKSKSNQPSPRVRKAKFKALEKRTSLLERATQTKTATLISKIVEKGILNDEQLDATGDQQYHDHQQGLELLRDITEEGNHLIRKVERQKKIMENQDRLIREAKKKIEHARKELRESRKLERGLRKSTPLKEDYTTRLDSLHTKLNEARARSGTFRQKIDEIRLQNMDDKKLVEDLEEQKTRLERKRKEMIDSIAPARTREKQIRGEISRVKAESSNVVENMKEEWEALGVFVDVKNEKERERLWKERKHQEKSLRERELKKQEEARAKLINFSPFGNALKQKLKRTADQQSSVNENKDSPALPIALAGNMTIQEENKLKSSIQQTRWQIARGHVALKTMDGRAKSLEDGFSMIREKTGIETPAEMVETFLEREEEVFRLFTHVNILSEQIEEVESSVEAEREEKERYQSKDVESSHGRSIREQLDERLAELLEKASEHEESVLKVTDVIEKIKSLTASMFVRIGCDATLIGKVLDVHPSRPMCESVHASNALTITEKNLLQYIGIVEHRVSEVLMIHSILSKNKPFESWKEPKPSKPLPNLPSIETTDEDEENLSDQESDEDSLRPMSFEELMKQVVSNVQKR